MKKIRSNSYNKSLYFKMLEKGFKNLHFSDGLEDGFSSYYDERFKKTMTYSVLISLMIFGLSGIFDIFFAPQVMPLQIIRFLIIFPLVLFFYFLMTRIKKFENQSQNILIIIILIITSGTLAIALLQPYPMRDMYFNGILLIQMFTFILSRLQFWRALITNFIIYIMLLIALTLDNQSNAYLFIAHSFIYLAGSLILAFSSYLLERSVRINYLQHQLLIAEQEELKTAKNHLERLSIIDGLTGISNHRHFHEILRNDWNRNVRKKEKMALLIIDVDYFKQYNDLYGHLAGDHCLQEIAHILKKVVKRTTDLTARYGGDEFVVLLNDITLEGVENILLKIQKEMRELNLEHEFNIGKRVTVSIGCIITLPERKNSPNDFLAVADHALYQAKNSGRNRAVLINTDEVEEKDLSILKKSSLHVGKQILDF